MRESLGLQGCKVEPRPTYTCTWDLRVIRYLRRSECTCPITNTLSVEVLVHIRVSLLIPMV